MPAVFVETNIDRQKVSVYSLFRHSYAVKTEHFGAIRE